VALLLKVLNGQVRPANELIRAALPILQVRPLRLRELSVLGFEAAMYLKQSDATASLRLSSQRKRDLLDHYETNGDELDRWREFNARLP